MRKIINLFLTVNGDTLFKDTNKSPTIFVGENLSTMIRFYFENRVFDDTSKYSKVITIKNKDKINSYNLNSNEYLLKKEDLESPTNIIITLEITKIEEYGQPEFLMKYVSMPIEVRFADGVVPTADWKAEYEDLFEQSMNTTLGDFKLKVDTLSQDVEILKTEDATNDQLILDLQKELKSKIISRKW